MISDHSCQRTLEHNTSHHTATVISVQMKWESLMRRLRSGDLPHTAASVTRAGTRSHTATTAITGSVSS